MSLVLNGVVRQTKGKSAARQDRREEYLPGVLYGLKDNVPLKVRPKELKKLLAEEGRNALIDLKLEGDSQDRRKVLLKDHQEHPLKEGWVHVDFIELDMSKPIKAEVPIRLEGHSPGEKLGGLVNHLVHTLDVECLPGDIPREFVINMAEVQLDQVVHVSDLKVGDSVHVLNRPGDAVVTVHIEKVIEEKPEGEVAAEGEAAAAAEPAKKEES
ncbi:MAG: 50S ribosomal protein L25 [Nitrospinaceae bacterium]|nr:MAG: 50S ribosomal protein L25 [Nitrospinaceae bacterium]